MQFDCATLRRPAYWLALSLTLVAVSLLTACGTASQPESSIPAGNTESAGTASGEAQHQDAHSNPSNGSGSTTASDGATVINLPIVNRATTLTRQDLRVTRGETVRLTFTADEHGEVHLHGYDLTAQVSPEHPGQLEFTAENAGAFGINFHVFAAANMQDATHSNEHGHDGTAAETLVSDVRVGVSITAEADRQGGVDVGIDVEGMRFAPESVDQAHSAGAGHAHIYVDGEKLGRVFESTYRIDNLSPGDHEIRVSLNTNDHRELVYDGKKADDTVTVTVPDVGQPAGAGDHDGRSDQDAQNEGDGQHEGHDHAGHDHDEKEIVAEVHLGNLEVYP